MSSPAIRTIGRNGHTPTAAQVPTTPAPTVHVKVEARDVGEIRSDSIYTLTEFSRRCGLARWGVRELRLAGLKIFEFHGRKFVAGKSFIEFLESQGSQSDG